jgi:hypothetical protein
MDWRVFFADDGTGEAVTPVTALALPTEAQASPAAFGPMLAEESASISHQGASGADYQTMIAYARAYLEYYGVPYWDGVVEIYGHLGLLPWEVLARFNNMPFDIRRYLAQEAVGVMGLTGIDYRLDQAGITSAVHFINPGRLTPVSGFGWFRNLPPDLIASNPTWAQKRPNFWKQLGAMAVDLALQAAGNAVAPGVGGALLGMAGPWANSEIGL